MSRIPKYVSIIDSMISKSELLNVLYISLCIPNSPCIFTINRFVFIDYVISVSMRRGNRYYSFLYFSIFTLSIVLSVWTSARILTRMSWCPLIYVFRVNRHVFSSMHLCGIRLSMLSSFGPSTGTYTSGWFFSIHASRSYSAYRDGYTEFNLSSADCLSYAGRSMHTRRTS